MMKINNVIKITTVVALVLGVKGSFPAKSMAFDPKGRKIEMKDLEVGMSVLSMHNNGTIFNEEVISIIKSDPDTEQIYIRVIYLDPLDKKSPRGLLLSPSHLILKGKFAIESVAAKDLKVGEKIIIYLKGYVYARIVEIKRAKGAFSPITESGKMLVDGVLVSCYEGFPSHIIAHTVYKYYIRYVKRYPWIQNIFDTKWYNRSVSDYLIKGVFHIYVNYVKSGNGNQDL